MYDSERYQNGRRTGTKAAHEPVWIHPERKATMGKSGRGRYGNGKTLRSPYPEIDGHAAEGLLARVVRGTNSVSRFERQKFTDEFSYPDGLRGLADVFTRGSDERRLAADSASVYYSLGKRGRWSLPQHLKADAREGCLESGRLTVVERYLPSRKRGSTEPDCICVTDSRAEVKSRTPKKTYSRFQDLMTVDPDGPEVCYEFSYPYPADSWANFAQSRYTYSKFWYLRNTKKAAGKNKGVRNKGKRWGVYSEHDLKTIGKAGGLHDFPSSSKKEKGKLDKVQVLDSKQFKKLKRSQEKRYPGFDLGTHIDNLLQKGSAQAKPVQAGKATGVPVQKFGKKSVVYIDVAPSTPEPQETAACPVVFKPEVTYTADLNISSHDLTPMQLTQDWGKAYTEGASLPRKFVVDATYLLQKCHRDMNSQICQLLFQEKGRVCNGTNYTVTSVSLVGSSLADSEFCYEKIAEQFSDTLKEKKKAQDIWSVHDVVSLGILTFSEHISVEDRLYCHDNTSDKPVPLKMLSDMFGWQSTPLLPTCAKAELRQSLENNEQRSLADGPILANYTCLTTAQCGICYQELYGEGASSFTSLMECQHSFCNDCWEAHLKTQISKNTVRILCPEYKCDCPVDNITIMAVVPSWYNKYQYRRIDTALEVSPEWQRCPTDRCHRIVKATLPASKDAKKAFPVACNCGGLWCFKCRKRAHWPITCEEADSFGEITRTYLETAEANVRELITSVFVRKCPKCSYPIEKHLGCNFMYCILCNTSFCWECLTPWDVHGDKCKKIAQSDEIDLTLQSQTDRFLYYINMVKQNALAKHSPLITHQKLNLQFLRSNVESFQALHPLTKANLQKGGSQHWKKFLDAKTAGILASLFQFKFEAHFTLEGAAKLAAMSRRMEKRLRCTLHQLQFIVDRITLLQQEGFSTLIKEENLQKVELFVVCGKKCMCSIGKVISHRV